MRRWRQSSGNWAWHERIVRHPARPRFRSACIRTVRTSRRENRFRSSPLKTHCALTHFSCGNTTDMNDKFEKWCLAALLAVFALSVAFELNGSSLGMWNRYVPNSRAIAPVCGIPRPIRSDEWAVFTPMTLAQVHARPSFPYFNDLPRAMPTDMFSVYAQPVRHPLLVFRPFLAGFVLFGFNRGLAFFWAGRWLALLLAMYALFKFLTNGDKPLAGCAALMVVLSPVVQWWGAINALAEILIFGSVFVLCFDRFMTGRSLRGAVAAGRRHGIFRDRLRHDAVSRRDGFVCLRLRLSVPLDRHAEGEWVPAGQEVRPLRGFDRGGFDGHSRLVCRPIRRCVPDTPGNGVSGQAVRLRRRVPQRIRAVVGQPVFPVDFAGRRRREPVQSRAVPRFFPSGRRFGRVFAVSAETSRRPRRPSSRRFRRTWLLSGRQRSMREISIPRWNVGEIWIRQKR